MNEPPNSSQTHISVVAILYKWIAPTIIVLLFIVVPDLITRTPLWMSSFFDWLGRIFLTIVFCIQYRGFSRPASYTEFWGDTLETNSLGGQRIAKALYMFRILVHCAVVVYFTERGLATFVPPLGNWRFAVALFNGLVHFHNLFIRYQTYKIHLKVGLV